ncbi:hypothetical protein TRAPUB_6214 [Trametes pubescens]|uniref:Uncharacterized protein n=1 Tax=Trametes pubescens TaxID=154538 RepID=A0A1M2V6P8_TRAPU|nr:hypothetical protein TRAPUB_6214 [Trametes pubescens]
MSGFWRGAACGLRPAAYATHTPISSRWTYREGQVAHAAEAAYGAPTLRSRGTPRRSNYAK